MSEARVILTPAARDALENACGDYWVQCGKETVTIRQLCDDHAWMEETITHALDQLAFGKFAAGTLAERIAAALKRIDEQAARIAELDRQLSASDHPQPAQPEPQGCRWRHDDPAAIYVGRSKDGEVDLWTKLEGGKRLYDYTISDARNCTWDRVYEGGYFQEAADAYAAMQAKPQRPSEATVRRVAEAMVDIAREGSASEAKATPADTMADAFHSLADRVTGLEQWQWRVTEQQAATTTPQPDRYQDMLRRIERLEERAALAWPEQATPAEAPKPEPERWAVPDKSTPELTPLWVRENVGDKWLLRYFQKMQDGRVRAFYSGTNSLDLAWRYAVLADPARPQGPSMGYVPQGRGEAKP